MVIPRQQANRDVDDAVSYYLSEAGEAVALRVIHALEKAYAHELNLPALRAWPLAGYPFTLFYVDNPDHIDLWRVLHSQRDIPAWMQAPDNG